MIRLQYERELRGLNQKQLEAKTGVAQNWICQMEKGRMFPYPGWAKKLENYFEMPIDELMKPVLIVDEFKALVLFENFAKWILNPKDPSIEDFYLDLGHANDHHDDPKVIAAEMLVYMRDFVCGGGK